ncbi:circularly permuted type 2 ATP-grasp protein [bacterium BFN5]|nr:circularly permuted type 2 ATP-grasp protein [bacterium BFN5]
MFSDYSFSPEYYDEMFDGSGSVRDHYSGVYSRLSQMNSLQLMDRHQAICRQMIKQGITFTLYGGDSQEMLERTIPFDPIPRIIPAGEWEVIESGVIQRVKAINCFLRDIYHEQRILKDDVVPRSMIVANAYFRPEMMHMDVPGDVYVPFSGIDLIRDEQGNYFVLEDNLRTPSGISYLYKNRMLMRQLFPELFTKYNIRSLSQGLHQFLAGLRSLAPDNKSNPRVVLLTPGSYNSAYFEHTFLAREMGIDLVEGQDLKIMNHKVYIKTMQGLQQVDVIYRRIDDDYLDPVCFRSDSVIGVPGLMSAYRAGNVAIANAPGTGVADDKAIYSFVPDIIRYYLAEKPILQNVPTYLVENDSQREYVLANLPKMVVKETSLSGGYGMLIGPHADEQERAAFAAKIRQTPERYIAQPTIRLSRVPCITNNGMAPRHVDLRPYAVMGAGQSVHVVPGGLTRVALKHGSLVVNSSQGGGSKDTWVLE